MIIFVLFLNGKYFMEEFKKGDIVWFIKHYFPSKRIPYDTYKVRKGKLVEVTPNVKVIANDRKTVLRTITHYIIKGLPNNIFENVYKSEIEALEEFKQLKDKYNLLEYYKS
jgi:hypothetical protein